MQQRIHQIDDWRPLGEMLGIAPDALVVLLGVASCSSASGQGAQLFRLLRGAIERLIDQSVARTKTMTLQWNTVSASSSTDTAPIAPLHHRHHANSTTALVSSAGSVPPAVTDRIAASASPPPDWAGRAPWSSPRRTLNVLPARLTERSWPPMRVQQRSVRGPRFQQLFSQHVFRRRSTSVCLGMPVFVNGRRRRASRRAGIWL